MGRIWSRSPGSAIHPGRATVRVTIRRPSSFASNMSLSTKVGPSGTRASRSISAGACSAKNARCSLENSLGSGRVPSTASRIRAPVVVPLSDPEHTPIAPGSTSTSTLKSGDFRRRAGIGRDDRSQLDDRVASPAPDAACPNDKSRAIEGQIRGVEEEHLARLSLDRIHGNAGDRRPVLLRRHGQLQLNAVRSLHGGKQLGELVRRDACSRGRSRSRCHCRSPLVGHAPKRSIRTPSRNPRSLTVRDFTSSLSRTVRTMHAPARITSARFGWRPTIVRRSSASRVR